MHSASLTQRLMPALVLIGAVLPISGALAGEASAEGARLMLRGKLIAHFRTPNAGLSPERRAQLAAERLDAFRGQVLTPQAVELRPLGNSEALYVHGTVILIATRAEAAARGEQLHRVAARWADNVREALCGDSAPAKTDANSETSSRREKASALHRRSASTPSRSESGRNERSAIIVAVNGPGTNGDTTCAYDDARKLHTLLRTRRYRHIAIIADQENSGLPEATPGADTATHLYSALERELISARARRVQYLFFAFVGRSGDGGSLTSEEVLLPGRFDTSDPSSMIKVGDLLRVLTGAGPERATPIAHVTVFLESGRPVADGRSRLRTMELPLLDQGRSLHLFSACHASVPPPQPESSTGSEPRPNARGSVFTEKFVQLLQSGRYENWLEFGEALAREVRATSALSTAGAKAKTPRGYEQDPVIISFPQTETSARTLRAFLPAAIHSRRKERKIAAR